MTKQYFKELVRGTGKKNLKEPLKDHRYLYLDLYFVDDIGKIPNCILSYLCRYHCFGSKIRLMRIRFQQFLGMRISIQIRVRILVKKYRYGINFSEVIKN